jgi:hypothetical protein
VRSWSYQDTVQCIQQLPASQRRRVDGRGNPRTEHTEHGSRQHDRFLLGAGRTRAASRASVRVPGGNGVTPRAPAAPNGASDPSRSTWIPRQRTEHALPPACATASLEEPLHGPLPFAVLCTTPVRRTRTTLGVPQREVTLRSSGTAEPAVHGTYRPRTGPAALPRGCWRRAEQDRRSWERTRTASTLATDRERRFRRWGSSSASGVISV